MKEEGIYKHLKKGTTGKTHEERRIRTKKEKEQRKANKKISEAREGYQERREVNSRPIPQTRSSISKEEEAILHRNREAKERTKKRRA